MKLSTLNSILVFCETAFPAIFFSTLGVLIGFILFSGKLPLIILAAKILIVIGAIECCVYLGLLAYWEYKTR